MNQQTLDKLNQALAGARFTKKIKTAHACVQLAQELIMVERAVGSGLSLIATDEGDPSVSEQASMFRIQRILQRGRRRDFSRAEASAFVTGEGFVSHVGGRHVAILRASGERLAIITGNFGEWL